MGYSNSSLTNYTRISPNKTSPRNHSIDRITPHCYVGNVSVQDMGQWFANESAQASPNYGIGVDGSVGLFVEEKDRSWCSSSRDNDNRAVAIECASDKTHPYAINDKVYNKLIELMADICRRNGKNKLLWFGDKDKTLAYNPKENEMVMTVHRWFANKSCVPIDSEVLTKNGWKPIGDVEIGEEIACADLDGLNVTFEEVYDKVPIREQDTYTNNGLTATKDHRMVYHTQHNNECRIDYYKNILSYGSGVYIPMAGHYKGSGLDFTEEMEAFLIATQADGHYMYEPNKNGERKYYGVEFHLSKPRKILRIKELLNELCLPYTETFQPNGTTKIRIFNFDGINIVNDICEKYLSNKNFTWEWIDMSQEQAEFFLREILFWDGCEAANIYTSSKSINLDVVSAVAVMNNVGSRKYGDNIQFRENPYITLGEESRRNSKQHGTAKTKVCCVSVKTGIFIMRQNGKTFITGNCPGDFIYNRLPQITARVNEILAGSAPSTDIKWYRVRKTWKDEKSQIGAYEVLENAIAACPVGYSVFDDTGKAVYTQEGPHVYSPEEWFAEIAPIAQDLAKKNAILPSVPIAQTYLETGCGTTDLTAKRNIIGMKADLINATWQQWSCWDGTIYTKYSPEYENGQLAQRPSDFRVYKSFKECLSDYEAFLLHVRNDKGYKYASIAGMKDPAAVIHKIRIGTGTDLNPEGYCTDPNYETKILKIINQFNLTQYDYVMPDEKPAPSGDKYVVRKSFDNLNSQTNSYNNLDYAKKEADRYPGYSVYEAATGKCIYTSPKAEPQPKDIYGVQWDLTDEGIKYRLGKFHDLNNAKRLADDNWGYKVYNIETNQLVYAPKLAQWQEYCAYLVRMDLIVRDDIKAKEYWDYRNKNTSSFSKTFDDARKNDNRHTNCVTGSQWGIIGIGIPRKAIQWYGGADRIVWVGKDAEKNCKKYFHVLRVGNKTVKQCIKDGTIVPGDIITYVKLSHTNAYIGNGLSFDTGHAFCVGSGEGAKFKHWIDSTPYLGYKVAYVLRLKN